MRIQPDSPSPRAHPVMRYSPHNRLLLVGFLITLASCASLKESDSFRESARGPMRGFQIQILTTSEKSSAEMTVAEAQQWWAHLEEVEQKNLYGAARIPVEIKWLQPYYRVRVGNFRSREEARGVLKELAVQFPAAFIVPDTIE